MSEAIDWNVAARVGVGLLRPGPSLTAGERAEVVTRLRRAAERAVELEAAASRLPGSGDAGVTLVVDRAGIVRANAASMASLFKGMGDDEAGRRVGEVFQAIGGKTIGVGAGMVLAAVGSAVLGQYEPFSGRLLLAAPNVEAVRASIGADPDDFALWVCLHEQTHRHQFAAAPWLRDYMIDLIGRATRVDEITPEKTAKPRPSSLGERVRSSVPNSRTIRDAARSAPPSDGLVGVLRSTSVGPLIAEVTAVMSLLEGYADMLMDMAGGAVIPTMPAIRAAFDERRRHPRRDLGALVRWLFGFTAKINQYVVGKAFCEAVCRSVGLDGLNQAFSRREALPTADELHKPEAWVERLFGSGQVVDQGDGSSGSAAVE